MGKGTHVQDLHNNLDVRVGGVDGIRDLAVTVGLALRVELGGGKNGIAILIVNRNTALFIWRNTAGDNHADTTRCTLRIEGGHALETVGHFLKAGVH